MAKPNPTVREVLLMLEGLVSVVKDIDKKLDTLRTDPSIPSLKVRVAILEYIAGACFISVIGQVIYLVFHK